MRKNMPKSFAELGQFMNEKSEFLPPTLNQNLQYLTSQYFDRGEHGVYFNDRNNGLGPNSVFIVDLTGEHEGKRYSITYHRV